MTNTASTSRRTPALERRFQPVMVDEPSVEDTISILRGLKERYEVFHGVKISDQAIVSAAKLSKRYITDRFLPDKAIDLIDEACAMIRTEIDSMPQEMDDISREIMQHEIEEAALAKEDDELSRRQLEHVQTELKELREKFRVMKAQWEKEKKSIRQGAEAARGDRAGERRDRARSARIRPEQGCRAAVRQAARAQAAAGRGRKARGRGEGTAIPCCATA